MSTDINELMGALGDEEAAEEAEKPRAELCMWGLPLAEDLEATSLELAAFRHVELVRVGRGGALSTCVVGRVSGTEQWYRAAQSGTCTCTVGTEWYTTKGGYGDFLLSATEPATYTT